ncbi:MAG: hypothetical protein JNK46_12340 [Methylobacteriaceae bacterium]|nr:hypothetical protein [Methylobacteriaceae bacterium]
MASKAHEKPFTFHALLVDRDRLAQFLYSCAAVQVVYRDSEIVTESTGMLGGVGHAMGLPGGSAKRVSERLSPNWRKAIALSTFNHFLDRFKSLVEKPQEQLAYLVALHKNRAKQQLQLQNMFAQVQLYNEEADYCLYQAAKGANDVESVATVALVTLSPFAGAGSVAAAGKVFFLVLGTKSAIAFAQSDHDLKSLFGFAIGTLQAGALSLGEISNKAFEVIKDATVDASRNRLAQATATYLKTMEATAAELASAQKKLWSTQIAALFAKPDNKRFLEAMMKAQAAEVEALKGQMAAAGKQAVAASGAGQFMKAFGGKVVPGVCCAIDIVAEWQRWQDFNDRNESMSRGRP